MKKKVTVNERIDEGVLRWFGHMERMENERIAKRVYVGKCASSRSVGKPRKRWIDIVKDCLRKRSGYQASKENGGEWLGFVRGNACSVAQGMNP